MLKLLSAIFICFSAIAGICDDLKVFESDNLLYSFECSSSAHKACVAKGFTLSGREYISTLVKNTAGTKIVQLYKWSDTPNNEFAKFWEASRLIRIINVSSKNSALVHTSDFWMVRKKLSVTSKNMRQEKEVFRDELSCVALN